MSDDEYEDNVSREGGSEDEEGEQEEEEEQAAEGAEDEYEDADANRRRREANIKALQSGALEIHRKPLVPQILQVEDAAAVLKRAFRSPLPHAPPVSDSLRRALFARKQFVPWGGKPFRMGPPSISPPKPEEEEEEAPPAPLPAPSAVELPEGIEPLILWEPPPGVEGRPVAVDAMLVQKLRPHQREGVQFMFECVTGLRGYGGQGCILADDMGLGKTLQGISLMWTLLSSGHELLGGTPIARRGLIICPTSLVQNWESEFTKWIPGKARVLALAESSRDDVICAMEEFLRPSFPYHVLIVSYETFRLHAARFQREGSCDILMCDEAHRLKNDETQTNKALDSLPCKRRVLLSGTPLQNDLDEFYAMVSFCNPGILGRINEFRRKFEGPILKGREPGATEQEVETGLAKSAELSAAVNPFILRRTNTVLSDHLPPKIVTIVCCKLTPLQEALYSHFLSSKAALKMIKAAQEAAEGAGKAKGTAKVLSAITSLKKLCNHPKLIYDAIHGKAAEDRDKGDGDIFRNAGHLFPPGVFDDGRPGRGGMAVGWESLGGKFSLLAAMLASLWRETTDRIVVISNYTQTLELIHQLCRERGYPAVRLDGSVAVKKRQKLVKEFCDPYQDQFVFLLSSKAGGCGLNLVGANRLVLFDSDWNPASDAQAAARVWRDGQRRKVYEYRFMATGTIDEKIFQRQLSKEGLQAVVNGKAGANKSNLMSTEELRDLFSLKETVSDTWEACQRRQRKSAEGADEAACSDDEETETEEDDDIVVVDGEGAPRGRGRGRKATVLVPEFKPQEGAPSNEDLARWAHHPSVATLEDAVLKRVGADVVTFAFTKNVHGKPVQEADGYESGRRPQFGGVRPGGGGGLGGGSTSRRPGLDQAKAASVAGAGAGALSRGGGTIGAAKMQRPGGLMGAAGQRPGGGFSAPGMARPALAPLHANRPAPAPAPGQRFHPPGPSLGGPLKRPAPSAGGMGGAGGPAKRPFGTGAGGTADGHGGGV